MQNNCHKIYPQNGYKKSSWKPFLAMKFRKDLEIEMKSDKNCWNKFLIWKKVISNYLVKVAVDPIVRHKEAMTVIAKDLWLKSEFIYYNNQDSLN